MTGSGPARVDFVMISRSSFMQFTHRIYKKLLVALALTSVTLFAGSAYGQTPTPRSNSPQKEVAAAEPKPGKPDNKVAAQEPRSNDLNSDIEAVKAENVAVRELLRKMEEQQKALLEQVDRLQRRLDGPATANAQSPGQTGGSPQVADATVPLTNAANDPARPANAGNVPAPQASGGKEDRYQDGIII